jgi:ATP-dependent protease ClpP protease subunit
MEKSMFLMDVWERGKLKAAGDDEPIYVVVNVPGGERTTRIKIACKLQCDHHLKIG